MESSDVGFGHLKKTIMRPKVRVSSNERRSDTTQRLTCHLSISSSHRRCEEMQVVRRNETPRSHSYAHVSILSSILTMLVTKPPLSYHVCISTNCEPRFKISVQRSNQRRSDGNTQFLLYLTSRPKWVENQGETAAAVPLARFR